ncbi:hypothetical protein GGR57DRAFT_505123 [Xylariaceae sp. FL1272]|nr:hypothetical protein GGR57DRAFT_505123 [Xylariaceae sp. FL1272]
MPATPVLRRRNGRPQACEPCRKRKVACDHSQPICERCIKRRQVGDCVYVLSPGSPKPAIESRCPSSPAYSTSPKTYQNGIPTTRTEVSTPKSSEVLSSRTTAPGYLGFTSFSAVFEETQISLSEHTRLQGAQETPPASDAQSQASLVQDAFVLSPRTQEACMYILRNVPEPSRGKICLRGSPVESWVYYFLDEVLDSLYATFGHYFGPQRSDASLQELARIISRNTALPFSDEDDITPSEWKAQFSGANTRWETLGLFFAFWDFTVKSVSLEKSLTQDEYGRPSRITKDAVDFCVELCNEFSPANSMFLFLSFRRLVVETQINGDINRQSWKLLSETVALLTYMGYHVLPDTPKYIPTFASEIKRKLYYHIYTIHMSLVSLTGRPPLMSHRYCTTPIPLDIPNHILFCDDKESFLKVLDGIDHKGWDKAGRKLSSSPMRARAKTALLREEILYFALGPKQDVSVEALVDVKTRVSRLYPEEFPKFLQNDTSLFDSGNEVAVIYFSLVISLEHLLNMFFIERLLLRHGHIQNELLSVSFDMVTNTLLFWTHQDSLSPWRADCEWLIMAFGVPAGGILCQELLKPTVHNDPRITRSSIIQKLSLLVGFLDWIKPSAPNGDLCGKCKMIIKHVLDQALNAPATGFTSAEGFAFDWDLSTQVDFDFDLLDTFGWTRSDFSLSQQSNV